MWLVLVRSASNAGMEGKPGLSTSKLQLISHVFDCIPASSGWRVTVHIRAVESPSGEGGVRHGRVRPKVSEGHKYSTTVIDAARDAVTTRQHQLIPDRVCYQIRGSAVGIRPEKAASTLGMRSAIE